MIYKLGPFEYITPLYSCQDVNYAVVIRILSRLKEVEEAIYPKSG